MSSVSSPWSHGRAHPDGEGVYRGRIKRGGRHVMGASGIPHMTIASGSRPRVTVDSLEQMLSAPKGRRVIYTRPANLAALPHDITSDFALLLTST